MKRLNPIIAIFAVVGLFCIFPAKTEAQQTARFSKPIPIGGDPSSEAVFPDGTALKFFTHPINSSGKGNFLELPSGLKVEGFKPSLIHDLAAPGKRSNHPWSIGAVEQMPDSPPLFPKVLHGIGFNDLSIQIGNALKLKFILSLRLAGGNNTDKNLMLADIRNETKIDELKTLFGKDPLEAGLIGDAEILMPYPTEDLYPAVVINKEDPFAWYYPSPIFSVIFPLAGRPDLLKHTIGPDKFDQVYLYGMDDIKTGIVAASYDPLNLAVEPVIGIEGELFGPPQINVGAAFDLGPLLTGLKKQIKKFPYISPMVFFRAAGRDDRADPPRYIFSGYTSWLMPHFYFPEPGVAITPRQEFQNLKELFKTFFTNLIVPVATNPTTVKKMYLGGSGVGDNTDYATVYSAPLFSSDEYMLDLYGRPVYSPREKKNITYFEGMGVCVDDGQGGCSECRRLPGMDEIWSPVIFWKQAKQWGAPEYEGRNPSHAFEPAIYSLVRANAYSSAVLEDANGQSLLIPSDRDHDFGKGEGNVRMIFKISPATASNFCMRWWKLTAADPFAYDRDLNIKTPLLVPDVISFETDNKNFVPYEIKTADLEVDGCQDIFITWRGKKTVKIGAGTDVPVRFDDGNGRMFLNRFTVIPRAPMDGLCTEGEPKNIDIPESPDKPVLVSSIAVADVDGDGMIEVFAGNLSPEPDENGNKTGFAYLLHAPNFVTIMADGTNEGMERIRTGFADSSSQPKGVYGPGLIEADYSYGLDGQKHVALVQKNGLPLMLPEIGCQDFKDSQSTTVAGPYDTYSSILRNLMSGIGFASDPVPLKDVLGHPVAQRCMNYDACNVPLSPTQKFDLPLLQLDECCANDCAIYKSTKCKSFWKNHDETFEYEAAMDLRCATQPVSETCPIFTEEFNMIILSDKECCQNPCKQACIDRCSIGFDPPPSPWRVAHPTYCAALESALQGSHTAPADQVKCKDIVSASYPSTAGESGASASSPIVDKAVLTKLFPAYADKIDQLDDTQLKTTETQMLDFWKTPQAESFFLLPMTNHLINQAPELIKKLNIGPEGLILPDLTSLVPAKKMQIVPSAMPVAGCALAAVGGAGSAGTAGTGGMPPPPSGTGSVPPPTQGYCECGQGKPRCPIASTVCDGCHCVVSGTVGGTTTSGSSIKIDDIRLPHGWSFPGEVTTVIRLFPDKCKPDGFLDTSTGEQCDTANMTPELASAHIAERCPFKDGRKADVCDMNNCKCNYVQPACLLKSDAAACKQDADCPGDDICDVTCKCRQLTAAGQEPPIYTSTAIPLNDCWLEPVDPPSSPQWEAIKKTFEEVYKTKSGRTDLPVVMPGREIAAKCRVSVGLPAKAIAANAGSPSYMFVQKAGLPPLDFTKVSSEEIKPIDRFLRIAPLEAASNAGGKTLVLPDFSLSSDISPLFSAATPLPSFMESRGGPAPVLTLENGVMIVDNRVQYQVATESEPDSGEDVILHTFKVRAPWFGSFTAVEGYKDVSFEVNGELLAQEIAKRAATGEKTSSILAGLPSNVASPYSYQQYELIQTTYENSLKNRSLAFFIADQPVSGGGCGCRMGMASGIPQALPLLFAVVLSVGGIFASRLRKK